MTTGVLILPVEREIKIVSIADDTDAVLAELLGVSAPVLGMRPRLEQKEVWFGNAHAEPTNDNSFHIDDEIVTGNLLILGLAQTSVDLHDVRSRVTWLDDPQVSTIIAFGSFPEVRAYTGFERTDLSIEEQIKEFESSALKRIVVLHHRPKMHIAFDYTFPQSQDEK